MAKARRNRFERGTPVLLGSRQARLSGWGSARQEVPMVVGAEGEEAAIGADGEVLATVDRAASMLSR